MDVTFCDLGYIRIHEGRIIYGDSWSKSGKNVGLDDKNEGIHLT